MREIVTLHFGQTGIQLGNAAWELLCVEHGINETGALKEEPREIECLETFFTMGHTGNFVPRTVYIDLEPTVVDEVRKGSYRQLFNANHLISGPEDASSNFARGFFTVGKLIMNEITYELRRIIESCNNVHGLMIYRGLGGGTGSGLTSAIFENLAEYPKTYKLEVPIYPSPTLSTSTVEPYNCLLAQHFCMEDVDIGLLFDNEAIYDICSKKLNQPRATYGTINRLIAQVCSNLTVSLRFENTICLDLSVLQTNIVPYPRIHFPACSFAPMVSESCNNGTEISINNLSKSVFDSETQMIKIDSSFGKIMSCALSFRGEVSPYEVYKALAEIKSNRMITFVDWCPTGFRVGINGCPPSMVPDSCLAETKRNVTLLTTTSAIGQAWQRLVHKFYMLYSKKSFVHWFVAEGMEECEFTESLYNISSLIKDYEECVLDSDYNKTKEESGKTIETTDLDSESKQPGLKSSMKHSSGGGEISATKEKITSLFNEKLNTKEEDESSVENRRNLSDHNFTDNCERFQIDKEDNYDENMRLEEDTIYDQEKYDNDDGQAEEDKLSDQDKEAEKSQEDAAYDYGYQDEEDKKSDDNNEPKEESKEYVADLINVPEEDEDEEVEDELEEIDDAMEQISDEVIEEEHNSEDYDS